jgi:hypothetical protein
MLWSNGDDVADSALLSRPSCSKTQVMNYECEAQGRSLGFGPGRLGRDDFRPATKIAFQCRRQQLSSLTTANDQIIDIQAHLCSEHRAPEMRYANYVGRSSIHNSVDTQPPSQLDILLMTLIRRRRREGKARRGSEGHRGKKSWHGYGRPRNERVREVACMMTSNRAPLTRRGEARIIAFSPGGQTDERTRPLSLSHKSP